MSVEVRAQRASGLSPDTERLAATTRQLVARSEGVLLLAQAVWLFISGYTDPIVPPGERIIFALGALHLVAAGLAVKYGGPFARGGGWRVLWLGAAFLVAPLMAVLVPYGAYGASPSCVQMCGYPVPPIVLLAFYPWLSVGARVLRPSLEILIVGAFVLMPIVLIGRTHEFVTRDNIASWIVTSSMYVVAYLVGRTIGRLCQTATSAQIGAALDAERDSTGRAYDTLHDEIEHARNAAEVYVRAGNPELVRQSLGQIKDIIVRERARSLLVIKDQISVATLVTLQVRLVKSAIPTVHVSELGHVTIGPETADLLNSALAALLKNVVEHSGAQTLWIEGGVGTEFLHLDVRDDGRGFLPEVLDDPRMSLHGLRDRLRRAGGDLLKLPSDRGAHLQNWLPFDPADPEAAA